MTIKQQIHNLFYGENNRQENRRWHYGLMTNDEWLAMVANGALTMPDQLRTWGIDISGRWDGIVDLSVTRARGGDFVFIKGLDGTVRTRLYAENRRNAILAGLLHGPYFWLYPDNKVPCKAQAQEGTRFMQEFPSDLPAMLDFEWTRYAGEYANPNYTDLDKWATEYLAQGNRKPLLYSAAGYMNQFGQIPNSIKAKFAGLVIANYGVINPTLPMGYLGWDFWQASASGDAEELSPNSYGKLEVDIDYWRSDTASLYAFAGTQQEPPAEEIPMARYTVTVPTTSGVALRPDHNTANDPHLYVPAGTVLGTDTEPFIAPVELSNSAGIYQMIGDRWASVTYGGKTGWVAVIHRGVQFCKMVDNQPPTEPIPTQPGAVPYTITLGGGDSPYPEVTYSGTLEPK